MIGEKGYTAKQVCKITRVDYSTLDYWVRTGFIKPSIDEGQGTGNKRRYSFSDLVLIKVAASLRKDGVTLQKLRKVIEYLSQNTDSISNPITGSVLITDGKTVFKVTDNNDILIDILRGGQLVWALPLGKMVTNLKRKATAVVKEEIA